MPQDSSLVLGHNQVWLQRAQQVQIQAVDTQPGLDRSMRLTVRSMRLSWLAARGCGEAWERHHTWWVITGMRNAYETGLQPECTEDFRATREEGHNTLRYGHTFLLTPLVPVQSAMRLGRKFATMPHAMA
jgi:hypothetical protein